MVDAVHQVVVIGGGFAGLHAVQELKDAPVQVTLLDRRNFHLFQPLLYQVATGTLSPGNIAASLRATLRHQKNALILLGEMTGLDLAGKRVQLKDGASLPFDTLIVATGSEPYYIRHDEWRTFAPGLKTVEDAITIRSRMLRAFESAERETDPARIREWLTFVVVGAGPTGVELAGAVSEVAKKTLAQDFRNIDPKNAQILLINGHNRILPEFTEDLSRKATHGLERLGVQVRNNLFVTGVGEDHVLVGKPPEQQRIATRTVLWAAGVRASPLGAVIARCTGVALDKEGRVPVTSNLTLDGHPELFVLGDLACALQDGTPLPGTAAVAIQQGQYAAEEIARRLAGEASEPFHYHHRGSLATIGRHRAVADLGWVRFDGFLAWMTWALVHLSQIIAFEDRLLVFVQWVWSYITWYRSDLLITYAPPPGGDGPPPETKSASEEARR
jgi:NADH dehydrogenase